MTLELRESDLDAVQLAMSRIASIGAAMIRDQAHLAAYVQAEADHIHNLPSYMLDQNLARHSYYWNTERRVYMERVTVLGLDSVPNAVTLTSWDELWSIYRTYNASIPAEYRFESDTSQGAPADAGKPRR
ncbi:MAG: hypothetical protein QGH60_13890 [Phycisphaerae bacterium]|nr:hypothetical protein [Phycisphaerae bacterium]